MSHISLGTITPNKVSLFKVEATSSAGVPLEYFYESGRLPQGLSVHPTGEIFGVTKENWWELDGGITSIDAYQTTFDRLYTFSVRATNKDRPVTATHDYRIELRPITNGQVGNIYAKINCDKATKIVFDRFVANTKIFPPETLYRMSDKNFQTSRREVLILSGVRVEYLSTVQNLMAENFYNLKLRIGGFKSAKAKNPSGDVIYEVVYAELIDAYDKSPNSAINKNGDTIYINSIKNLRTVLTAGLDADPFEYLPHWMKSTQDNQVASGYKLVLPIRYVQPGQADQIIFKLTKEQDFDLKSIFFQIDRLYVDKHKGTTIDDLRLSQTVTGDGNTKTFVLPQYVTEPKHVQVTIDGVGVNTLDAAGVPIYTVDSINDSSAQDSAQADSTALYSSLITFRVAPASGSQITFKRKPTTFGLKEFCTFDRPNEALPAITADTVDVSADVTHLETSYLPTVETIFDERGTRFHTQPFTLDQKQPENTQLLFARENVMDGFNNTSKHRDLIRKAI